MTRGSQENAPSARTAPAGRTLRLVFPILGLIVLAGISSSQYAKAAAGDPAGATSGTLVEIKIEGNNSIDDQKVRAKLSCRAGRPYDKAAVDADLRTLLATKWFSDVNYKVEHSKDGKGYVLTFKVSEMPILKSVEFIGRKKVSLKEITESTDLKKGSRADAIRAQLAKRQILQLYKDKGYEKAEVELLEGGKPGDTRVVISIFEGPKYQTGKVDFVGNKFVSDAVLSTKITSRPPIAFGLGGHYSREGFDEDAEKLRDYYQNNGYLSAQVRPVVRSGSDLGRQDLTFVIEEGPRFRVRNIVFDGNKKLTTDVLKKGLRLHSGEFYNDSIRTADRMSLQSSYFGIGCIDAAINVQPRYTESPDVLDLVYKIEEGDIYRLGQIMVRGNEKTMDKVVRREAEMAGLLPGEILDINRIEKYKNRLANTGFFSNDPRSGGKPIDIRIINRRPADKPYGDTVIFDLGDTPRSRMQNPEDLPPPIIPQGPKVDNSPPARGPSQLAPFGSNLFAPPVDTLPPIPVPVAPPLVDTGPLQGGGMGGRPVKTDRDGRPTKPGLPITDGNDGRPATPEFTNAGDVGPDRQEPFAGRTPSAFADVVTNVDEASTARVMFSVGATSFGGLNSSLILQETNFDLFALPRSLSDITDGRAFRGAGQQFRLELSPGTLINRYVVSFSDPYLFNLPVGLQTSGYQLTRYYTDWSERRGGGKFGLGKQFGPSIYADIAFRIEDVDIHGFKYPAPASLLAVAGHTTLASLRPSIKYDTRNNPFAPSSGSYAEAAFEQGWGTFSFPKLTLEGRQHFTTGSRPDGSGKRVLTLRSFFGVTGRDTPIYEKFFAGDFHSMRGFYYRGVGPHQLGVNVGGVWTGISSVEYQFPWTANDQLSQVVFCDFGTVEQNYTLTQMRAAVGTGVRVLIPQLFKQVPLAFDIAFPVVKAEGDRTRYFTFFIGSFW